ncbi:uncharacterized protein LOC109728773 [Ananas comosus]|uniref:Uncharacterized protein LOC109728773 n=1 Tax=Ananas comosus TaxID=4615 RepID=A0A6P5HPZ1_ANACO|nr:uncharacterized protein LOC109728773 [Ananas comosus]
MGLPMSLLGKFGLPGINAAATNQVYERYFKDKEIKTFEDFHINFVIFCKEFNAALPGQHYDVSASREEIKVFYDEKWKESTEKPKTFFEFMEKHLKERKTNPSAMITTGLAAPAAAMALKRTGQNIPAVKNFRLNLIPDVVFVPSCTLLALFGVRLLQLKSST